MHRFLRFLFIFLATVPLSLFPAEAPPTLADLGSQTDLWIGLRGTLAEEERTWRQQKAAWLSELQLLEEEQRALATELTRSQDRISTVEEDKAGTLTRKENAEQQLRELDTVLDRAIAQARSLVEMAPESLKSGWGSEVLSFAEDGSPNAPRSQRAQRLVALLSAIESLQNRFHTTRETVESSEITRQVDVVYLGLARGFAVSPGNDWSAVGVPAADGWMWIPGGVDPLAVRKLIQVYERQETAALVTVPLAVEEAP